MSDDLGLTDEDVMELQYHLDRNRQESGSKPEKERLPPKVIDKIIDDAVVTKRQYSKRQHLPDRESDKVKPACGAPNKLGWRKLSREKRPDWWGWCEKCRAIAFERYRP